MPQNFRHRIAPYIEAELRNAESAHRAQTQEVAFQYLENAHVLGQASTYWHTRVHLLMLAWAIRNRSVQEVIGQVFRVFGALTKTAVGLVPEGNTGGANVSPFKPMPINPELQDILHSVQTDARH